MLGDISWKQWCTFKHRLTSMPVGPEIALTKDCVIYFTIWSKTRILQHFCNKQKVSKSFFAFITLTELPFCLMNWNASDRFSKFFFYREEHCTFHHASMYKSEMTLSWQTVPMYVHLTSMKMHEIPGPWSYLSPASSVVPSPHTTSSIPRRGCCSDCQGRRVSI